MTTILSTDPALSIPAPDPIGRLYRKPGSEPLPTNAQGETRIPSKKQLLEKLTQGEYLPSITNIIDVLNSPHLNKWSARVALEKLVEIETQYPGNFMRNQTKAINYLTDEANRIKDAAALAGTNVHEACEYLALGKEIPKPLTLEEQNAVDAWKRWRDMWEPEFLAVEYTVFGETDTGLGYAGTADFVIKLKNDKIVAGDLKTTRSGLHSEVSLQLTAIARAQQCTLDDMTLQDNFKIDAGIGVLLSVDGSFQVKQIDMSENKWKTFQGLRQAWTFSSFKGHTGEDEPPFVKSVLKPTDII